MIILNEKLFREGSRQRKKRKAAEAKEKLINEAVENARKNKEQIDNLKAQGWGFDSNPGTQTHPVGGGGIEYTRGSSNNSVLSTPPPNKKQIQQQKKYYDSMVQSVKYNYNPAPQQPSRMTRFKRSVLDNYYNARENIGNTYQTVRGKVNNAYQTTKGKVGSIFQTTKEKVSNAGNKVGSIFTGLSNKVTGVFKKGNNSQPVTTPPPPVNSPQQVTTNLGESVMKKAYNTPITEVKKQEAPNINQQSEISADSIKPDSTNPGGNPPAAETPKPETETPKPAAETPKPAAETPTGSGESVAKAGESSGVGSSASEFLEKHGKALKGVGIGLAAAGGLYLLNKMANNKNRNEE